MALTELRRQFGNNLGYPAKLGSLLVDFVESGGLTREINQMLQSLESAGFQNLNRIGTDMLMLLEDEEFVLQLKRFQGTGSRPGEASPYLGTPASGAIVLLIGRGQQWVRRYQADRAIDLEVFTPGVKLRLLDERVYDGAPVHERLSDMMIYEYCSDEDFMMLRLAYRPFADQCWNFDRATLTAQFPSVGLMEHFVLVNTAKVLGALGDKGALPHLLELAGHPSHFVRWASIQAVGLLDRGAAIDLLKRSVNDAHPHVRSKAAKVLAKFGAQHG